MFQSLTVMLMAAAASQPASEPVNASLGEIRMHLVYQETGRLSPDISPPNSFAGHNVIIGEGSAEENANDVLVLAEVRANGHQSFTGPVAVSARVGRRTIGSRRFNSMLTSNAGRTYLPLYLQDVGCAGNIQVEVRFGRERRTETLSLHCGE